MSDLKCPMCQSTDIYTFRDNPDDHGMRWETYHRCKNCGRVTRDYCWEELTEKEILTAEVERLKAENGKLKKAIGLINSVACGSFANGCVEDEIFNICKDTLGESELTKQTYKVIYDCVMKKLEGQGKVPDFIGQDTNVPANDTDNNVERKGDEE